jgi:succinate dehydrogenase flavin-adding protein (antitoxin of CptAB toxin-antitoxin module)
MIKREQELFEQIANALSIEENLTYEERVDLMFSALFELDKIQKGQLDKLSEEQLQEVSSKDATSALIEHIENTTKTDNPQIKSIRNTLTEVMRQPWKFGLSPKMRSVVLLPFANTSIAPQGEAPIHIEEGAILQLKDWMARNELPNPDFGKDAPSAQIFVDALRKGEFYVVSKFSNWVVNKYMDPKLNPNQFPIGADDIHQFVAYELAYTNITPEDLAALMQFSYLTGSNQLCQYSAVTMFSGVTNLQSRLSALNREFPLENPQQILQRMKDEHSAFLKSDDPHKVIKDEGIPFKKEDTPDLREHYSEDKILVFNQQHIDSITTHLILLNTKDANPEDIKYLLALKDKLIQRMIYLETKPKELSNQDCVEQLKTANKALKILQEGGAFKNVRDSITEQLILLNTQNANSNNILYLSSIKNIIIQKINHLETYPTELSEQDCTNRLKIANTALNILQAGGKYQEVLKSITPLLLELNTKNANAEDIENLKTAKDQIINYINYLETNPPNKSKQTYNNRLNAAYRMLNAIDRGGSIQEDIIPKIKAQAQVISTNKPGIRELGFIGWLQSFFDKYTPQMSRETSKIINKIESAVEALPNQEVVYSESQDDIPLTLLNNK